MPPTISILNRSSVLRDEQIAPVVAALQIQVSRDFAPIHNQNAYLNFVGKNQLPDADSWQLIIGDDSTIVGALGYHDRTPAGRPIGYAFPQADIKAGTSWTNTLSHELLEMLADPDTERCVYVFGKKKTLFVAYEVCDACEGDQFGYQISGVLVSDFVRPSWFWNKAKSGPFDFTNHITKPLQLLKDGYVQIFDTASDKWSDVVGNVAANYVAPQIGSRRWLREVRHERNLES